MTYPADGIGQKPTRDWIVSKQTASSGRLKQPTESEAALSFAATTGTSERGYFSTLRDQSTENRTLRRHGTAMACLKAAKMRTRGLQTAAPRSAQVPMHHPPTNVSACPLWACRNRESSRRRRELVGLRALFCECAMRGAQPPHPTLLVFTNIKQTYTVTVENGTSPTLEGPGAYSLG